MVKCDPIVALATPQGISGVSIIRVSGKGCVQIIEQLTQSPIPQPRQASLHSIYNHEKKIIDEAIVIYFKAPNSFTGEDVVEIQGHGGLLIPRLIIERCISLGCRLAEPGEFSLRAFHNEKMDLVQAESLHDVITAQTESQAQAALSSMRGTFSKGVHQLQQQLTNIRLNIESLIDFSDEEIKPDKAQENAIETMCQKIKHILADARSSQEFYRTKSIVLAGEPNVGKSSWLNLLTAEDVAIVTDIAGTTRDLLKHQIRLGSQIVNLIDSAGLRETQETVEKEGIRRSYNSIENADLLIWLVDAHDVDQLDNLWPKLFACDPDPKKVKVLLNKLDTLNNPVSKEMTWKHCPCFFVSAKCHDDRDIIMNEMSKFFEGMATPQFLARSRHIYELDQALQHLVSSQKNLLHENIVLCAEDLRNVQYCLDKLVGKFSNEELLTQIFGNFCIGK